MATTIVVDLRYVGQGHELTIPLPDRPLTSDDGVAIAERFETLYRKIYGIRLDHVDIEITAWSLTLAAPSAPVVPLPPVAGTRVPAPTGRRSVLEPGQGRMVTYALYWRADLEPGDRLVGPAIIAEDETSTVVPGSWSAAITAAGAILLEWAQAP